MYSTGGFPHLLFLLVDTGATVTHAALREMWERWLGPERFYRKLEQLSKRGLLQGETKPGDISRIACLNNDGRIAALGGRDPEACWNRAWDGQWRIAMFDVPESERDLRQKLRRKLHQLGFGCLQQSVWITPDSLSTVKALLSEAAIDVERLAFMEAQPCGGESNQNLVLGAWSFTQINRNYDLYLQILDNHASVRSAKDRRAWFRTENKAWAKATEADPFLPHALLPDGYRGKEALKRRIAHLRHIFKIG